MMCIFDGISMALQSYYLVCVRLYIASCTHGQIELSVSSLSYLKTMRIMLLITIIQASKGQTGFVQ